MKKALFALVVAAMAAGPVRAQQDEWANKLFDERSKDFGTHPRGVQLKHSFKMTNIYKVPLEITNVRAECGCVTPTLSTKILQPNETAELHINMDSARFSGAKRVPVHITVGPEFVSTATVVVTAHARQDVVFNPGEIDFGTVAKGQTPSSFIDGAAPFNMKVEQLPQKVGGFVTVGYRISATLKPDATSGNFKQEIILKTNDPNASVITFHVLGNIRASLQVAPNPVNLGSLKTGAAETTKIVVSGGRPFRITGIDGLDKGMTIELPDSAKSTHILELRIEPQAAGELHKQLTIRTDLDGESAKITVEGTVSQ
jgi:Protein of unknown function (DUF1573)